MDSSREPGPVGVLDARAGRRGTVVVSSMASDAHTWNLVFLQLLVEELGFTVVNLGACVPDDVVLAECRDRDPVMILLSSVNGHGYQDGLRLIAKLRECGELARTPTVIGGKLVTDPDRTGFVDELVAAGFDAVFQDGMGDPTAFDHFVRALPPSGSAVLTGADRAGGARSARDVDGLRTGA